MLSFRAICAESNTSKGEESTASLYVVNDDTAATVKLATADPEVAAYLEKGKSYRITITLAPDPEKA